MIRRTLALTRCEMLKLRRQKLPWACALAVLVVAEVSLLLTHQAHRRAAAREEIYVMASGYDALAAGAGHAIQVGTLFLLALGAMLVASEGTLGTFRTVLVRPVRRAEVLLSKCLVLALFTAGLLILVAGVCAASIAVSPGFGDVKQFFHGSQKVLVPRADMLRYALAAFALQVLPLLAVGFLGLAVSTLTDNAGTAVAAAFIVFLPLKVIVPGLFEGLEPWLFTTWVSRPLDILSDISRNIHARAWDLPEVLRSLAVPAAWIAAFLGVALWRFCGRDMPN
jgi:ABC-2 type transport system permease protein